MQLSYRKSAPHCRLLEAFEGFGCRSSSLPATIRHQRKRIDETWRVSLMRTMQVFLKNALLALSMPRSYGIFALPRRTLARVAAAATPSRNLYLTHRRQTAAEHNLSCLPGIRDSSTMLNKTGSSHVRLSIFGVMRSSGISICAQPPCHSSNIRAGRRMPYMKAVISSRQANKRMRITRHGMTSNACARD